ncbi:MAG: thioredoxin [Clostridia bacterium]|nr:thioredoxin [Clostridia bacterium]
MTVTELTEANFDQEVLGCALPVLIDFWASWCGPCRMMAPVVEEIAAEYPDVKVCKVNVDDEDTLAAQFGVMSIPTFVVMKDGRPVGKKVGVVPKDDLLDLLGK